MTSFKAVYFKGDRMMVRDVVMEQMRLHPGQSITEAQMLEIIELNVSAFVAERDLQRTAGNPNIPDCSELKNILARIQRKKSKSEE